MEEPNNRKSGQLLKESGGTVGHQVTWWPFSRNRSAISPLRTSLHLIFLPNCLNRSVPSSLTRLTPQAWKSSPRRPMHTLAKTVLSALLSRESTWLHQNQRQHMSISHRQPPSRHPLRTTATSPLTSTTSTGVSPTAIAVVTTTPPTAIHARAQRRPVLGEAAIALPVDQTRPPMRQTQTPTGAGRTTNLGTMPGRASRHALTRRVPQLSSRETRAGGADSCIGSPPNRSPRGSSTRGGSSDTKELANRRRRICLADPPQRRPAHRRTGWHPTSGGQRH